VCSESYCDCLKFGTWKLSRQHCVLSRTVTVLSSELEVKQVALCSESYCDCLKFRTWKLSRQLCVQSRTVTVLCSELGS